MVFAILSAVWGVSALKKKKKKQKSHKKRYSEKVVFAVFESKYFFLTIIYFYYLHVGPFSHFLYYENQGNICNSSCT